MICFAFRCGHFQRDKVRGGCNRINVYQAYTPEYTIKHNRVKGEQQREMLRPGGGYRDDGEFNFSAKYLTHSGKV